MKFNFFRFKFSLLFLLVIFIFINLFFVSRVHAITMVPSFDITVNENSVGGDGNFNFHVFSTTLPPEIKNFQEDYSINTTSGYGSHTTSGISFESETFFIIQDPANGWHAPSITCVSDNPNVTSVPIDGGVKIISLIYNSITCNFSNVPAPTGNSSVLFLPGIKGSVLKTGSDTLWPPTFFSVNDVAQLALTKDGESVNDVYVDGILNTFYIASIYGPFSSFMDSLVSDKTIERWLPLAYDWRFSPETILVNGIKTKDKTLDVIEEVEKLAKDSKTGKVTIISHSMGGLLGKAIIKKLQDEGKDSIIDTFVMVGTPQLGTPQAVASILHGDDEGILGGFIVNPIGIRRIAQNMPSAYNLLPSPKYFDVASDPVIKFDSGSSFTQAWRNFWGTTINTYPSFLSFITGTGVKRVKPVEQKLEDPEVLRSDLTTDAKNFHNTYDNYQFPDHIRVVQVAGWGGPTVKAVEYKTYHGYSDYNTIFTVEGDRVVVYPSAVSSIADETYFFNISLFNKDSSQDIQHRDLFNSMPVQDVIKDIIKENPILLTNYISATKPPLTETDTQLIISTHSPVILGAYDQFGNFTGIDPNQNLSADILSIKEDIPGSAFVYTSDSQNIFLPKDGNYNFVYKGTGSGQTTMEIENFSADVATPIVSYTDIPTTASTVANFTVQSTTPENTKISLDTNGDGKMDQTISADNAELSLNEIIAFIKFKISTLNINERIKQNLLKQISNLEKKIENKRLKNIKVLVDIGKKIMQEIKGKINTADATEITNLLNILEAQADDVVFDPAIFTSLKARIQSFKIKANLKNDLFRRVESLQNNQAIVKALFNLSKNIIKKAEKGKIADFDAQALIILITQVQNMI
ncbi:MAG: hypothetical protein WCG28_00160 [bacterium]